MSVQANLQTTPSKIRQAAFRGMFNLGPLGVCSSRVHVVFIPENVRTRAHMPVAHFARTSGNEHVS